MVKAGELGTRPSPWVWGTMGLPAKPSAALLLPLLAFLPEPLELPPETALLAELKSFPSKFLPDAFLVGNAATRRLSSLPFPSPVDFWPDVGAGLDDTVSDWSTDADVIGDAIAEVGLLAPSETTELIT